MAATNEHNIHPWWETLGYHNQKNVHELLEKYRIGNIINGKLLEIKPKEVRNELRIERKALNDTCFSFEPFVAETPTHILSEHYYTPVRYHFVRNHFSVPKLTYDDTFSISGLGLPNIIDTDDNNDDNDDEYGDDDEPCITLSYRDLLNMIFKEKRLKYIYQDVYLQCGGHRRIEYAKYGKPKGSYWTLGAVGNGKYGGVLLKHFLISIGVDLHKLIDDNKQIWITLIGHDSAPDGERYGVSIPLEKVYSNNGGVMLALGTYIILIHTRLYLNIFCIYFIYI